MNVCNQKLNDAIKFISHFMILYDVSKILRNHCHRISVYLFYELNVCAVRSFVSCRIGFTFYRLWHQSIKYYSNDVNLSYDHNGYNGHAFHCFYVILSFNVIAKWSMVNGQWLVGYCSFVPIWISNSFLIPFWIM